MVYWKTVSTHQQEGFALYDIWLCDDETVYLHNLEERIAPVLPNVRLRQFHDPAAVRSAARESLPDILIMDIEFGAANGIHLANELCFRAEKPVKVLYLTAYGERYCQRIFTGQVKPEGYLTKPVEDAYLFYHLEQCIASLEALASNNDVILYPKNRALCSIPCREVLALESKGHTIHICARDGRTDRSFQGRLDEWEEKLPEDFIRPHKSYLVNMMYIDRIDRSNILLQGGRSVPISRSKQEETRTRYLLYRGAKL